MEFIKNNIYLMKVIMPESYSSQNINILLKENKIVYAKNNLAYQNTIFPEKTEIRTLNEFSRNSIVTKIEDSFFDDFFILDKLEQTIYLQNNTIRRHIKCIEFGDIDNSYKRYNNVNSPIDYNRNSTEFLNLDNVKLRPQILYKQDNIFVPDNNSKVSLDNVYNNMPKIKNNVNNFKRFNDKTTIEYTLKWAKDQGIKFIYAIIENRPYIINKNYTTAFTYYTIIGQK